MINHTSYTRPFPDERMNHYELDRRMNKGEKRALHCWIACGHDVDEAPVSRYLPPCRIPKEWDFLDVYRLDKELEADTAGMDPLQKEAFIKCYFEDDDLDEELPFPEEEPENNKQEKLKRRLFWMWEFICSEDLSEEAEDYMKEHMEQETPFEW